MDLNYSFDDIIDRRNTSSYKYDLRKKLFGDATVQPMWVADMDFRTPDFVVKVLENRLEHPIYGYTTQRETLVEAVMSWVYRRHKWTVKQEWIGFMPGVVPALNMAVLAFTQPGDKIIIQTPVYFPFYTAVTDHDRELVLNPLVLESGHYYMDFDNLRRQIDRKTRMIILCSPHNPTGNVWSREELLELAGICLQNDIILISDEIHADLVYPGNKHIPVASLSEEIADRSVTLMAASKSFNFAGLAHSYFIASNRELFKKLQGINDKLHLGMGNIFGNLATEAAYLDGDAWLAQLIIYLQKSIDFVHDFLREQIPCIELIRPEATFLLWLDFRKTGLSDREIKIRLVEKARLGLSEGSIFGQEGKGFQRMNIGCPVKIVEEAMQNLKNTFCIV